MANPEHLEMLKSGVQEWNEWRFTRRQKDHGVHAVDLTRADLSGLDLSDYDLKMALLQGSNLSYCSLDQANIERGEMEAADLSDTFLQGTNFFACNLRDANFRDAYVSMCNFSYTFLRGAKGLETCRFVVDSAIDHRTLFMSWPIPITFLRGIGLPDSYIEQIPSLIGAMQPIQFYSVFISYSSKDKRFAKRLYNDLQGEGIRCWFAPEDLKTGDRFRSKIHEAIRLYDKLLVILSMDSIESDWVEREVEQAFRKERGSKGDVLFPIAIDTKALKSELPLIDDIRGSRHIADFVGWKTNHDKYLASFNRIVRDLKASAS